MENIIEISHLHKEFKEVVAVKDLSFKVKKGELLGFVGNAAGSANSVGWAPHVHMTLYNSSSYNTGLSTSSIEKLYNIKSNTNRKAGE